MGNLILSKLVNSVARALKDDLIVDKVFCWTDSTVSLAWIKSTDKVFRVFVQNRVTVIRENVKSEDWYYCRTGVNPADVITRNGGDPRSSCGVKDPNF